MIPSQPEGCTCNLYVSEDGAEVETCEACEAMIESGELDRQCHLAEMMDAWGWS